MTDTQLQQLIPTSSPKYDWSDAVTVTIDAPSQEREVAVRRLNGSPALPEYYIITKTLNT